MQKPNYQFEKRRKEMDKKAKKDEKRRQKLAAGRSPAAGDTTAPSSPVEPACRRSPGWLILSTSAVTDLMRV